MEKSEIEKCKGHIHVQWALAILANMTIVTFGLQLGWVSPATNILKSESSPTGRPLTDTEITWIASVLCLAAMPGVIASSYIADVYGRKIGVLLIAMLQLISWIIIICPCNVISLMIARISAGLASGGCFHVVPMYVKEISQSSIAGTLGSLIMLSQNLGVIAMYALGGYLEYYTGLWIIVGLPLLTFVVFLKAPESPAFLVKIGKIENAEKALIFLRGLDKNDEELQKELDAIKKEDELFKSLPQMSLVTIFKNKASRRGFLVMFLVMFAHGYNGTTAIINYAAALLASSGITISPELQSLCVPIFMTAGSILSVYIIDRVGRKILLSLSFIALTIGLLILATTQLIQSLDGSPPSWLPVLAMATAVFAHGVGVAPIPYVVMLEMFQFQIRAKLMGIIILNTWFMVFAQILTLDIITTLFGVYTSFYWFAGVNLLGAVVVVFLMPETRGKTVEEIENELIGVKKLYIEK